MSGWAPDPDSMMQYELEETPEMVSPPAVVEATPPRLRFVTTLGRCYVCYRETNTAAVIRKSGSGKEFVMTVHEHCYSPSGRRSGT